MATDEQQAWDREHGPFAKYAEGSPYREKPAPPKPGACGATTETCSGEYVSPCHKPSGHAGEHEGRCLGSPAVWTD